MPEARFYHVSPAGHITSVAALDDAMARVKGNGYLWLDYFQPEKKDLAALIEPLGLHPLSIEDCFDEEQIPKIEDYPRNTFILFNAFSYTEKHLTIHEIDLFIGEKFLVTVSHYNLDNRLLLRDIERLFSLEIETAKQGPAYLAHIILDYIVDRKFLAIEALEEDLDNAEDLILADYSHFNPGELMRLRRELMGIRKSLFHERELLVKICRKDCIYIPEASLLYYRDIYDHLAKFFELTESYRDIVTSLMEMYLTMINNQMTKAANDTNTTVRRLTLIATIFMPLTLLAGIGGMSEWTMMTGPENWRIAYPFFLLAMVVIGVADYFLLKWLEKKPHIFD